MSVYQACTKDADGNTPECDIVSHGVRGDWCQMFEAAPDLLAACRLLLSAMDMQEKRETEEFHIPSHTARAIWDHAKDEANAAIKKAVG